MLRRARDLARRARTSSAARGEFALPLQPGLHDFFFDGLHWARLLRQAGARFRIEDGEVHVAIASLDVIVQTSEDLLILHEVFGRRVYDFALPAPVIVWDIGANVGFAALAFARREDVMAVYSFEPFPETAAQMRRNVALNPAAASKIVLEESAIGRREATVTATYSYAWKGHATLHGTPTLVAPDARPCTVRAIRASDALDRIRRQHRDVPLVAKIDCEGAEEEILLALAESSRLQAISAVMVEWHQGGPEPLRRLLAEQGFSTFLVAEDGSGGGMVYGHRA
jgi:FkbM family methyltransferase